MKNYLKGLLLRLFISIFIIFTILTIIDKVIYYNDNRIKWIKEDKIIKSMNIAKLQNSYWEKDDFIYKKKDDGKLANKGTKKRILVIGDSYIYGDGYSNANHVWWQQLYRTLYENGYDNVEVIAAGLCGYSTKDELDNIIKNKAVMEEVDPDLIIIGYVTNDPEFSDNEGKFLIKTIIDDDLFYNVNSNLVNFVKSRWKNLYSKFSYATLSKYYLDVDFQEKFGFQYNLWTEKIISGKWREQYKNILLDLSDYIDNELNLPYFFVTLSSFPELTPGMQEAIKLFDEINIPYYNFYNYFMKKYPYAIYSNEEWGINPANAHPAVKTTVTYSDFVFNILQNNFSNIIGKKNNNIEIDLDINDWMPYSLKPTLISNNKYKINYPNKNEINSFLSLPINKNYVKLNLRFPLPIKSIKITGDNIESIELYTNSINKILGYDDQVMKNIGKKSKDFIWYLNNDDLITSINISANTQNNKSTDMYIEINY